MTAGTLVRNTSIANLPDPPPLGIDGQIGWGGLVFGDGTPYVIADSGLTGWEDLPGFDSGDTPRTADHGLWPGARYAQARTITATLWLAPAINSATAAALAALRAATALSDTEQWLTIQLHGETLAVAARMAQRVIPTDRQFALRGTAKATLQWIATDPRRYIPVTNTAATGTPQPESGLTWPLTWPLNFGSQGVTGNLQLTNTGNIPVHPVITFAGPCSNPYLTNPATGALLGYNITLAATDTLTVDTNTGQVLLNNTANQRYTAMAGSAPEESFTLPPGATTLSYRPGTGQAPTSMTVTWRSAFL